MKRLLCLCALAALLARCGRPDFPSLPAISETPLNPVELQYRLRDVLTNGRGWSALVDCGWDEDLAHMEDNARKIIEDFGLENPEGLRIIQKTIGITGDPLALGLADLLTLRDEIRRVQRIHLSDYADQRFRYRSRILNDQGRMIDVEGTVSDFGAIDIISQQPIFYSCPVCLAAGALIATPSGAARVEDLRPGDLVWSAAADGTPLVAPILLTSRTAAPPGHRVARITLADGRRVAASLRHPTIDGRAVGDLAPGARLDGSAIVGLEREIYADEWTYDLLPAGATGWYWAGGIRLASTLHAASDRAVPAWPPRRPPGGR